jgi:hypothetical protein
MRNRENVQRKKKKMEKKLTASKHIASPPNPEHLTDVTFSLNAILFERQTRNLESLMQRQYRIKENREIEAAAVGRRIAARDRRVCMCPNA